MKALADIFGHKIIVDEAFSILTKEFPNKFIIINGPSGTGKSFIANQIASQWQALNEDYMVITLLGDSSRSEQPYFPIKNYLENVELRLNKLQFLSKGSVELSKGIPYAGDFVSYLLDTLTKYKSNKKVSSVRYLSPTEQLLLLDIDKITDNKRTLFVIDNVHWFDEQSLDLLYNIWDGKFNESFQNFKNFAFVLVNTTDQTPVSHSILNKVIRYEKNVHYDILPVPEEKYESALHFFGFKGTITKKIIHTLYLITGGHLLLIKRLAEYLSEEENIEEAIKTIDKDSFIKDIISYRLKNLEAGHSDIVRVLEYASIIGISFDYEELYCIINKDANTFDLSSIINKAKDSYLIEGTDKQINFSHDIVRGYFLLRLENRKLIYSSKFAECLRILKPSDYFTRAQYLFDSGNLYDSLVLYIIGYLKNIREGGHPLSSIHNRIIIYSKELELNEVFSSLVEAYSNFQNSNYLEAIDLLKKIEDIYPKKLLVEKYYLLSLCLSRPMENNYFKEAIDCLDNWDEFKSDESEIWLRIMATKLVMHSHLYDFNTAKKIEQKVMFHLNERTKYDKSSLDNINIIRRKSGSIHICEIAVERTKKSVDYFSQTNNQGGVINPLQYYMALTNHSGNLIAMGEFTEAFSYSKLALDTVWGEKSVTFPKFFIPANNYILSGVLSNNIKPSDAIIMYNSLIGEYSQGDHFLLKTNLAVMHCLNNDLKSSYEILLNVHDAIISRKELDNYYQYYILSNFACVNFLLGHKSKAIYLWNQISNKIPQVPEHNYLIRRHTLLKDSLLSDIDFNTIEWQNHLLKKHPQELGNGWNFFGNGFLVSDLQFWSES